jgi:capsular polysaccharide transport system ATP-binding protein
MISLHGVSQIYKQRKGPSQRVFDDVHAVFEPRGHYVILGRPSSGKSTLMRILAGLQSPTEGRVTRHGVVSPPLNLIPGMAGMKSGRELATFMAALYGADAREVEASAERMSGLAGAMDEPLATLSGLQRARLGYSLGYSLPCAFYLCDGSVGRGDRPFQELCERAFKQRQRDSGTIVALSDTKTAARLGDRGGVLHESKLYLFDTTAEAIDVYNRLNGQPRVIAASRIEAEEPVVEEAAAEEVVVETPPPLTATILPIAPDNDNVMTMLQPTARMLRMRDYPAALEVAAKCLAEHPGRPEPLWVIAQAHFGLEDHQEAARHAALVIDRQPDNRDALHLMARAHESGGSFAEAGDAWQKLALATGEAYVVRRAVNCFTKAQDWRRVLAIFGKTPGALTDAGAIQIKVRCLIEIGDVGLAGEALRQLTQSDPDRATKTLIGLIGTRHEIDLAELVRAACPALPQDHRSRGFKPIIDAMERQMAAIRPGENESRVSALREAVELARRFLAA